MTEMRGLNDKEIRKFHNYGLKIIDHGDMTELQIYDICRDMIGSSFRCVIGETIKCLANMFTPRNDTAGRSDNVEYARRVFKAVMK